MKKIVPSDTRIHGPVGSGYIDKGEPWELRQEYVVPADVFEAHYRCKVWLMNICMYGYVEYSFWRNGEDMLASGSQYNNPYDFSYYVQYDHVGPFSAGDRVQLWTKSPPHAAYGGGGGNYKDFMVCGTEVVPAYSEYCGLFEWIGDVFITIGQILRSIGDRMGTVWFVGDVIQAWFNAAASYFESTKDWFYGLASLCIYITGADFLGDAWTWLLGLWGDFSGAVTAALGSTWTDLQDMYTNFNSWVVNALGGTWTDLQDMWANFDSWVVNALGGTWTDLQDMYTNFNSWVTGALGDTWTWLLTLYGDFTGAVTGALGGMWEWLTEFVNDPMSKLSLDMLELVKSGFEWLTQEWFSFIDSTWDTFKGSFTWLMQKFFLLLDESWDSFEDSMKWLVGKTMDLVGNAAEDFKDKIWEMIEKVVKKL